MPESIGSQFSIIPQHWLGLVLLLNYHDTYMPLGFKQGIENNNSCGTGYLQPSCNLN